MNWARHQAKEQLDRPRFVDISRSTHQTITILSWLSTASVWLHIKQWMTYNLLSKEHKSGGYVTILSARSNTVFTSADKEHLHESIKNDYANVQWNARPNSLWFNNLPQHEYSSNKYYAQMHWLAQLGDEGKRAHRILFQFADWEVLTALCLDAETVFETFVWVGTGNDLWVGAAHVHVPLPLDDVAAIALQPLDCRTHTHTARDNSLVQNWRWCVVLLSRIDMLFSRLWKV